MVIDYEVLANAKFPIGSTIKNAPNLVKVGSVTEQFRNRFVAMYEVTYHDAEGKPQQARSLLVLPEAMLVLPMTRTGQIILVKVLRPGVNSYCWEMPQERMDMGDATIEDAAIRCAREEIGLVGDPAKVIPMTPFASMPDRVTEIKYPVVIIGDFDFESRLDKKEVADGCIATFTVNEVKQMILDGVIVCPCIISALAKFLWMQE